MVTCFKIAALCLLLLSTIVAVFLIAMIAQPYNNYFSLNEIEYPDTFGIMGGILYGPFLAWVFIPTQ